MYIFASPHYCTPRCSCTASDRTRRCQTEPCALHAQPIQFLVLALVQPAAIQARGAISVKPCVNTAATAGASATTAATFDGGNEPHLNSIGSVVSACKQMVCSIAATIV